MPSTKRSRAPGGHRAGSGTSTRAFRRRLAWSWGNSAGLACRAVSATKGTRRLRSIRPRASPVTETAATARAGPASTNACRSYSRRAESSSDFTDNIIEQPGHLNEAQAKHSPDGLVPNATTSSGRYDPLQDHQYKINSTIPSALRARTLTMPTGTPSSTSTRLRATSRRRARLGVLLAAPVSRRRTERTRSL